MSSPVSSRTSRFRAALSDSFLLTLPPGNVQSLCPTTCRTSKTEPLSSSIHAITETSFFGLNLALFFFAIRKRLLDPRQIGLRHGPEVILSRRRGLAV